ncbi:hypothetical protein B0H63DRAFT_471315 [Podospora didyma]|uniref:Uncharacterized protein n=1 Tax=Podospora didyma TaxID=330526 RepID=A0AAE0NUI8_9PEZI|nr:hypothetical protein B0H63DRAFT_471315 [Podospora didyma]
MSHGQQIPHHGSPDPIESVHEPAVMSQPAAHLSRMTSSFPAAAAAVINTKTTTVVTRTCRAVPWVVVTDKAQASGPGKVSHGDPLQALAITDHHDLLHPRAQEGQHGGGKAAVWDGAAVVAVDELLEIHQQVAPPLDHQAAESIRLRLVRPGINQPTNHASDVIQRETALQTAGLLAWHELGKSSGGWHETEVELGLARGPRGMGHQKMAEGARAELELAAVALRPAAAVFGALHGVVGRRRWPRDEADVRRGDHVDGRDFEVGVGHDLIARWAGLP